MSSNERVKYMTQTKAASLGKMLEDSKVTRDICVMLVTNVSDPGSTFNLVTFDGMTVKLSKADHILLIVKERKNSEFRKIHVRASMSPALTYGIPIIAKPCLYLC